MQALTTAAVVNDITKGENMENKKETSIDIKEFISKCKIIKTEYVYEGVLPEDTTEEMLEELLLQVCKVV